MASVASALMQVVFDKLGAVILKEFGLLLGLNRELDSLRSRVTAIRAVLEDAEERSSQDRATLDWLRKLKYMAYDADDLLDEFQTEALRRNASEMQKSMAQKVRGFFSSSNPVFFRYRMARNIKDIGERLNVIAAEKADLHLKEGPISKMTPDLSRRHTNSVVDESEIFGREEDKERVVRLLIEADTKKNVSVLAIVGIGGLGKTTLAQLAYNDERTKKHFGLRIWVCVSDDFEVTRLVKAIVECATQDACHYSEMEPLQLRLHEMLSGRRFLLVLDDVWNEDGEKWEGLKRLLRGGLQGSKVVVTTRSRRAASMMGTLPPHELATLPDDVCWALFWRRAFRGGEKTQMFAAIGREIVKKCGGLPLAAKSLGSVMGFKRSENEWIAIRDSETWRLREEENGILPALKLSYDYLPPHLKQCFAYCSLFPKGHEIDKEKLIRLWIAEGFIPLSDEVMQAEDIGEEYFDSLWWRSFFQEKRKCMMHDLVHDLARFVAGEECSTMGASEERGIPQGCRYSSLICNWKSSTIPNTSYEVKNLRTFLLLLPNQAYMKSEIKEIPQSMVSSLTHLRVLDLSRTGIRTLPDSIGELSHLRLLDMSGSLIETLPTSTTILYNLQMLILRGCRRLCELPEGMGSMGQLRNLDTYECVNLTRMPSGMGRLINLWTLSRFVVVEEHGRKLAELRHLNFLRGQLQIMNLEKVKSLKEAKEANLEAKRGLQRLELNWKGEIGGEGEVDVLDGLQPHPNLAELTVRGYRGIGFPSWMMMVEPDAFPNLTHIELCRLRRCERLPVLGMLASLRTLSIEGMSMVSEIGREFYGETGTFPSLGLLTLKEMPNLEKWETMSGREAFPCLTHLRVMRCPKLSAAPCLPMRVQDLRIVSSNEELFSTRSLGGEQRSSPQSSTSLLKKLEIASCKVSFGWEGLRCLTALEELTVEMCTELTCLPNSITAHLPSLRSLTISQCHNLTSLGEAGDGLAALHRLALRKCSRLAALPEWIEALSSLRSLGICSCCSIAALPNGLRWLTELKDLIIVDCPVLERRCQRDNGEDWHKIAQIPCIQISPGFSIRVQR